MIHFRYHLIAIAAIFLALGIGILLGGTAGQSWFAASEQEFWNRLEARYNQTLKSNHELKEQVDQLIDRVERNNEEVIHLLAARFADELNGQQVYIWRPETAAAGEVERVLGLAGLKVAEYRYGQSERETKTVPLLILGRETPHWLNSLAGNVRWMRVENAPKSPTEQWKLLEKVRELIKEVRWEREKS
ncbi:copper transporter [Brevibacillus sp. B_LB10_24]|uniref:copper transporter n=1 Tax=Brevibacillus sp. B_LB10_24 TaxID=3380645 RepID=UPI0038B94AED